MEILSKIEKFRMNEYIEYYKNNKKDRDLYREYVKSYKTYKVFSGDKIKTIISNFLILTISIYFMILVPTLLNNPITKELILLVTIFELSLAGIIALPFKILQCNYVLRQFDEIDNKEFNDKQKEQKKIIQMQKEILFYISDGIHNFGDKMFIKNENIEEKYFDNIRTFFTFSKCLSENLSKNLYSQEEYEKILHFIQKDFHDYFHHISKEFDLQKYITLVEKQN